MSDLVSIVLPVYNVEKYIDKCISSILKQEYVDIELIIVDDGSTDMSSKICDAWQNRDKRITVHHIKNGGVSNARNYGISCAKGAYVMFVDSDDCIDKKLVNKMIIAREKYEADLCVCGLFHVFSDKKIRISEKEGKYSMNEYARIMKKWKLSPLIGSPCNKLFETAVIKENNICFRNNTKYAEDYMFNIDYLRYVSSVYIMDEGLYYYNMETPGSLTKINSKNYEEWTNVQHDVYKKIKNYEEYLGEEKKINLSEEILAYMSTLNLYERIGKQSRKEINSYFNQIIRNDDFFRRCKNLENMPMMNMKYQIFRIDYLFGHMILSYWLVLFIKKLVHAI